MIVANTFAIILLAAPFQLFDYFYFSKKVDRFQLKTPPLFILGHWRSGTTLLHNLLCKDPRAAYVTTYHSVFPLHLKSRPFFGLFMKQLMPEYRPGDNIKMNIAYPQEDEYALSNMTHTAFYHAFYFPREWPALYEKYVRFKGLSLKEIRLWEKKYHELVVKACLNSGGEWPILKNPVNTARIPKLLPLYPEACFVHIVRHPVEVFSSSMKFFSAVIPALSFQKISREDIRQMILSVYEKLMKDYLNDKSLIPKEHLYELQYEKLIRNPVKEIIALYRYFHWEPSPRFVAALQKAVSEQKYHKTDHYLLTKTEWETIRNRWGFAFQEWGYDSSPKNVKII